MTKISDLRKLIARAGLECVDCIERSELESRAEEAQAILRRAHQRGGNERGAELPPELVAGVPPDPEVAQRTSVVHVPGFLSADEVAAVVALGADRRGARHGKACGSWKTLYLSAGGRFGAALPSVRDTLIDLARRVDAEHWGVLRGVDFAPRCVELH